MHVVMTETKVDHFTLPGAQALADRITSYWRTRGYYGVKVVTYSITDGESLCYGIRSNIRNGYPPRAKNDR